MLSALLSLLLTTQPTMALGPSEGLLIARIGRTTNPHLNSPSLVQPVKATKTNCKRGRGFKAKRCRVAKVGGDVLGTKCGGGHKGCDYSRAIKKGNPDILAVQAGKVSFAGWSGAYGNRIVIDHGGGHFTTYSHLSKFYVGRGTKVTSGQAIGRMGNTGKSTGVHLHFEVVKGGQFVNPGSTYRFCR